MTTQEYVNYLSHRLSEDKEDLIKDLINIIKMKMRLSGKTTESFVFCGSRYISEAPEKNEEKIK